MVGRARGQVVLGLMPTHWLLRLVLGLVPAHWCVQPCPSVSGCRALGVLGLVPAQWYEGPGPRSYGEQGQVLGWLWA